MLACETSERMSELTARKIRQTAAGIKGVKKKRRERQENKNASDGKAALMSV